MRGLHVVGVFLAPLSVALLVSSAQGGAAKPQPNAVKMTAAPVWTLAMSGPRVAYASAGRVYVWNVVTGATSGIKGRYSNAAHSVDAAEIAIAGKRVAWTKRQMLGNTEASERLYTAPVGGKARLIGSAYIGGGHTGWIGGVVGSGHLLADSTWRWDGTAVRRPRLNLVAPTGLRPIASGLSAIVAAAADGGHIAVLRSTAAWPHGPEDQAPPPPIKPSVSIYSAKGMLLRQIAFGYYNPGVFVKIALSGDRLAVLTTVPQAEPPFLTATVEVYDWTTGALVRSWPLAPHYLPPVSYEVLAVFRRLAILEGSQFKLHLLDLDSGKDVIVASNGSGPMVTGSGQAAINRRGLVYTVNTYPYHGRPHGKLVFVPMAKLLAALRQ